MNLFLIRHGQSHVNLKDWDGGNRDEGLTDLGHQQAAALARWIPDVLPKPDVIFSSTMLRARETARPLGKAYGLGITFEDRVREIGNNQLDHSPFPNEDLPDYTNDFWSSERPFASLSPLRQAESLVHFRARVGLFLEETIAERRGQNVVVVCHGGVIDVTFDHIFDTGMWRRCEVWTKNTAVTLFELVEIPNREVWRLHYHNRIDHLKDVQQSGYEESPYFAD